VRGAAKYQMFTFFGVRDEDGLTVRLGRANSLHAARGMALSILRATSMWRHIDIKDHRGRLTARVHKPQFGER